MGPLVSVVITTYNGLEVIERAIKSVQDQTYKNIEMIVVDDNGVGTVNQVETEKIIKKIDKDIKYIAHKVNLNGSQARNTGIMSSKGEYVALLDDDDVFRKNKIEKQVVMMEKKGSEYALCYTGVLIHHKNGMQKKLMSNKEGDIFREAILRKVHAQTSEFLLKKSLVLDLGGFDETFRRHQDWEFFDRLAYHYKIAVVPEVCVDRYIYERTSEKDPKKFEENRLYYLKKMGPYIKRLKDREKKELYFFHYRGILREYLKEKNIVKTVYYFCKCGNPIKTFKNLVVDYKSSSKT